MRCSKNYQTTPNYLNVRRNQCIFTMNLDSRDISGPRVIKIIPRNIGIIASYIDTRMISITVVSWQSITHIYKTAIYYLYSFTYRVIIINKYCLITWIPNKLNPLNRYIRRLVSSTDSRVIYLNLIYEISGTIEIKGHILENNIRNAFRGIKEPDLAVPIKPFQVFLSGYNCFPLPFSRNSYT